MNTNILLVYPIRWFGSLIQAIEQGTPSLYVTQNLEQVKGMVRDREVVRVCIICQSYNDSGQRSAEDIHAMDPALEIMVWNGRGANFGKTWDWVPLKYPNEYYLDTRTTSIPIEDVVKDFYAGKFDCEKIENTVWLGHDIVPFFFV